MEQRHHARVPIGFSTIIYRRGLPIATGRIRDASSRGLFIETECQDLQVYQSLQCELRGAQEHGGSRTRIQVLVVRSSAAGAGVEIDEADAPVVAALMAFARGEWRRSAR